LNDQEKLTRVIESIRVIETASRGIRGMAIALACSQDPSAPGYREALAIITASTDVIDALNILIADKAPIATEEHIRGIREVLH
jgi:hypothetical protein